MVAKDLMSPRLCAALLAALFFVLVGSAPAASHRVRAGFASVDLTPSPGLEMGGFGMNLDRKGEAVHDPLLARAVVLESSGRRMAIVGCDLGGLRASLVAKARVLIHDATGIEPAGVMVAATHTHSAPVVAQWIGVGKEDSDYLSVLPAKIAQAVITASSRVEAVELAYGEAAVQAVARNREYPDGPLDPKVRTLKFTRENGQLAGFVANYAVHPVVMAEKTRLYTGDLAGVATDKVARAFPGSVGIFLQGFCGDINPIYAHMQQAESLEKLELLADRLAKSMRTALGQSEEVFTVDKFDMISTQIDLPQLVPPKELVFERKMNAERWLKDTALPVELRRDAQFRLDSATAVLARFERLPLDRKTIEIQAARLANIIVLANPAETFQIFGKRAVESFPQFHVMVVGYANDYIGYIPAADRYDFEQLNGLSYPAYFTPWMCGEFRYREDVGDVLVSEMIGLGKRLVGQ